MSAVSGQTRVERGVFDEKSAARHNALSARRVTRLLTVHYSDTTTRPGQRRKQTPPATNAPAMWSIYPPPGHGLLRACWLASLPFVAGASSSAPKFACVPATSSPGPVPVSSCALSFHARRAQECAQSLPVDPPGSDGLCQFPLGLERRHGDLAYSSCCLLVVTGDKIHTRSTFDNFPGSQQMS